MAETIKDLCKKIASAYKMEGYEVIDGYFDFIPDDIESEKELEDLKQFNGHNEFSGADLKEYIESFSLLLGSIGTFITLRETLKKKRNTVNAELIKSSWKNRLLAEGIDPDKADSIVSSFNGDLKILLDGK